jgi:hypothetical protein
VTESLVLEPPSVVPPRFNRVPYCNPDHHNVSALEVLDGYSPEAVATSPDYLNNLSAAYEDEKAGEESSTEKEQCRDPVLDLRNPEHLEGMTSHTLAHSVVGLLDAGVSNTDCIPYWDRDAVFAGLSYQNPDTARQRLEVVDVLSMNALRSYCCFLGVKAGEHKNRMELLDQAMGRGQRTKMDMYDFQTVRREFNWREFNMHAALYAAKLKHLLWLVDQQPDPVLRNHMKPEVCNYVGYATSKLSLWDRELTVDMGVDTGISEYTTRPAYDISMFVQLQHQFEPGQDVQIYRLPQTDCIRLTVPDLLASIDRPDRSLPFYEEDGRYALPFKFD